MKLFLPFLFLLFLALLRAQDRLLNPSLRITFFDVSQGDSALIQFPRGRTLLIDAGGGFKDWNLGQRELFSELARKGILYLDDAILTHPDQDHAFGFVGLLDSLRIGRLWFNAAFNQSTPPIPLWESLRTKAIAKGTKLRSVSASESWEKDGVEFRLWVPSVNSGIRNDHSLVLELSFAGCRILFTGDIEVAAERALQPLLARVDVLKVAHHGSKTSTSRAFLNKIQPGVAVISSGVANRYGHPSPLVTHALLAQRVEVFRTDFHGFVELTVSGRQITCRNSQGFCGRYRCRG